MEASDRSKPRAFTATEFRILAVLAAIQFANLVDFIILMPLGPVFAEKLGLSDAGFGALVAAYGYAAGIVGFLAAFFIDRLPRKAALLGTLLGFTVGTGCCAVAPDFYWLLAARVVAGLFGGLLGGLVLTIIGDVIPGPRRGAATGIVMIGFSVATVLGIPFGLVLARYCGWQSPFVAVAVLAGLILLAAFAWMPSVQTVHNRQGGSPFVAVWETMTYAPHRRAFVLMAGLMLAGFSVVPYIAKYLVANTGYSVEMLPAMYFVGGLFTMFSVPYIGRLTDRFGRLTMFRILAVASMVPTVVLTTLGHAPEWLTIAVCTVFMVCMSGRGVPAMALIIGSADPRRRASFMSINGSVQQLSMGVATSISAAILGTSAHLERFPIVGLVACGCTAVCLFLAGRIVAADTPPLAELPAAEQLQIETVVLEGV